MDKVDTVVAAYADLASGSDGRVSTQLAQSLKPKKHSLRFVFQDKVVSFGVGADLSFGDVARTLRDLVPRHYGEPVSIDCIRATRKSG